MPGEDRSNGWLAKVLAERNVTSCEVLRWHACGRREYGNVRQIAANWELLNGFRRLNTNKDASEADDRTPKIWEGSIRFL